jgi:hypothetical protein
MLGFYLNDVIMTPVCRPETVVFSPLMLLPGLARGITGQEVSRHAHSAPGRHPRHRPATRLPKGIRFPEEDQASARCRACETTRP